MYGREIFKTCCLFLFAASSAAAEDPQESDTIEPFATSYFDVVTNTSGGLHRTTGVIADQIAGLKFEGETFVGWPGATFMVSAHAHAGRNPSTYVGDFQFTDSLEAPRNLELYETWYEQELGAGTTIRTGLLDYNFEFQYLESAWDFLNSSFALTPAVAALPPSTFPTLALGSRFKAEFESGAYVQIAAFDGSPGNPNKSRGTHVDLGREDGVFAGSEIGFENSRTKVAGGGWYRSTNFISVGGTEHSSNLGGYAVAEQALDDTGSLIGFGQIEIVQSDRNPFSRYVGFGIARTGLFASRPGDKLLFGVNHAHASGAFRSSVGEAASGESVVELSWLFVIADGIVLQPDLQYVHQPSADRAIPDAVVIALRARYFY